MTLFLTSSPTGCPYEPGPEIPVLDDRNHFVENLRAAWPSEPPCGLLLVADPDNHEGNDRAAEAFAACLRKSGLPLEELIVCDSRNQDEIGELLAQCNFLILGGGHVPTQNCFFSQLGLPALMQSYHGLVLGISAGSMNAARIVYALPEEPGEATDHHFSRWMSGLGLTDTRIYPHYQCTKDFKVDGKNLLEMGLADCTRRPVFGLPDGSYILCADGHETLYGEAWYIGDGRSELVNEDGQVLPLR